MPLALCDSTHRCLPWRRFRRAVPAAAALGAGSARSFAVEETALRRSAQNAFASGRRRCSPGHAAGHADRAIKRELADRISRSRLENCGDAPGGRTTIFSRSPKHELRIDYTSAASAALSGCLGVAAAAQKPRPTARSLASGPNNSDAESATGLRGRFPGRYNKKVRPPRVACLRTDGRTRSYKPYCRALLRLFILAFTRDLAFRSWKQCRWEFL